jgi:hypothetical protein
MFFPTNSLSPNVKYQWLLQVEWQQENHTEVNSAELQTCPFQLSAAPEGMLFHFSFHYIYIQK